MDALQTSRKNDLSKGNVTHFSDFSPLNVDQKFAFLESLQESLNLTELLQNFAAQVNSHIEFSSCRLAAGDMVTEVKLFEGQRYYRSFNVLDKQQIIACVTFTRDTPFSRNEIAQLRQFVQLLQKPAKHALHIARLQQRVRNDYLTGIGNRAHFDESLETAIEQQKRMSESDKGLVLVMLDLNKFKQVNDTFGHPTGDKVLVHFAEILKGIIRKGDQAFRLGGDEFAMLLAPACSKAVEKISLRIQEAMQQHQLLSQYDVSASLGYSSWHQGSDAGSLVRQADEDLYQSKRAAS